MKKISIFACLLVSFNLLQAQGLKDFMPENKYIGTAINDSYLAGGSNSEGYNEIFVENFNCVVAENAYKMAYIIPDRPEDPFNLTINDLSADQLKRVDAMIDSANKYNMRTRGHAFIWHSQAPSWLTSDAAEWTNQQIYDFAESYITVFATYCKGRIDEWDVVNEALNDNGAGFRTNTWYDKVDDKQDFIEHCFTVAHAVDPDTKLFYNDYSIGLYKFSPKAMGNVKNGPMITMVSKMVEKKVPIHGVGLQSHYISGSDMNDSTYIALEKTFDTLNTLGLLCNITELDIRICGGTNEADLIKQNDEYKKITELFLSKENGRSFLIWGISDESSWIPGTFSGCDDALLYDKEMEPKPAFYGVRQALMEASGIYVGPYSYLAPKIPGIIEAENYDYKDYADSDAGNTGGVYRTDSVDITEANTGYAVGWTEAGEYLTYSIDAEVTDTFSLGFVYASDIAQGSSSEIKLTIDGIALAENVMLPSTQSLDNFDTVTITNIILAEGEHKIQINFVSGGATIDYLDFSRVDCAGKRNGTAFVDRCEECVGGDTGLEACIYRVPYATMTIPGIIQAENYDDGDNEITYYDKTQGNEGGQYRTDDVDVGVDSTDVPVEVFVGYIDENEWLEYSLTIEESGNYDVTIRAASDMTTGSLSIQVNGRTVKTNTSIPSTGGWTTFQELEAGTVTLEAGEAILRITATGPYFNLDYVQFEKAEDPISVTESNNLQVKPYLFTTHIKIDGLRPNERWSLYSSEGSLLQEGTTDCIKTDDYLPGLYILKIGNESMKLIKM